MKIIIKTSKIKLSPSIQQYIFEKIGGLEKFISPLSVLKTKRMKKFIESKKNEFVQKIETDRIEALVRIEKTSAHHRKGDVFKVKTNFQFSGKNIIAESVKDNLFPAIDEVKQELQKEIKHYHKRQISRYKRRARALKKVFHLSYYSRFFRKGRIRDEGE